MWMISVQTQRKMSGVTSFNNSSSFSSETESCNPVTTVSHLFFTPILSLVFLVSFSDSDQRIALNNYLRSFTF